VEFVEHPAPPALADVVLGFWGVRMTPPYRQERIFPTPALHLVVNGGEPYRVVDAGKGDTGTVTRVFCSGLQTSALRHELPAAIVNVGARLYPDAARTLGLEPRTLAGRVVDVSEEFPELAALAEQLPGLGLAEALARLDATLLARRSGIPDPAVRRFVGAALDDPTSPIPALAELAGLGHDALIDAVRANIGVTPKAFADLVRFDRFVDLTARAAERGWAALAAEAGFYDQSHLIRVFRRFTGLTPAAYVRAVRSEGPGAGRFLEA
jgi:AraC-like DNA-binding protein